MKPFASVIRYVCLCILFLVSYCSINAQFRLGENPGYYGSQYTDQQIYDLMYAGGARAARSTVSVQYYLQYGMGTYQARLQYPYSTKGMRNNTFFLDASAGPYYTGQSTATSTSGAQSWLPGGLYNAPFNSDGSINSNNLWAQYCYDVVQSIGPYFTYFEVWNEPDLTGSINSYEDSTESPGSWEIVEPATGDLPNMNASIEDYVQLCMIASQVIKKYQPTAKIATGGLGYPWFYMWFLKDGGGSWIDELSIHCYPYFDWTTCSWTGSSCGPAGFHRNSDYAVFGLNQQIGNFRSIETQLGMPHKPIIMTESNIPGWNYVPAANLEVYPNNRAWGSDSTQKNYTIKAYTKMMEAGLDMFYLFQTGETADSGLNNGTSGSEIDAMGMYKNLTKATPGNEVLTSQGLAIRTMQNLLTNYTVDGTQPSFPAGVDGVRFDSSGNKIYVIWAITTLDMSESASGSFPLPAGSNFKEYLYDGSSPGTVSGTLSLIGDPYILVQTPGSGSSLSCNAGAAQTITAPANEVTLDASASTVSNSLITSYQWSQTAGPSAAVFSNPDSVITIAGNLVSGNYSFQLNEKDSNSDSCSSTVSVSVIQAQTVPPAETPVVVLTPSVQITLPVNATELIGSGSYEPGGTIASYLWSLASGPSGSMIANPENASTKVSALIAGTYVFNLTITDSAGVTASGTTTVIVNPYPSSISCNAGVPQTINVPASSAVLDASASKANNSLISTYLWSQVAGPNSAIFSKADSSTTTASNLIAGSYTFQVQEKNNNNNSCSSTVTVTVLDPAKPKAAATPVVVLLSSAQVTLPTNTTVLVGSGSYETGGSIASYLWSLVSGPSGSTIADADFSNTSVTGLIAGNYIFKLTITDLAGIKASGTTSVKVNPDSTADIVPPAQDSNALVTAAVTTATRLVLFPNPAQGTLNLRLSGDTTGAMVLNIYSMMGQLVLSVQSQKTGPIYQHSMDISGLASGVYLLQAIVSRQQILKSKFIKQ
jgi:Secretion system C-terminal sorting domain